MENIEEYQVAVKKLAENGSTTFISNSSQEHAAVIIEEIFLNAKGTVNILCDCLNPVVYGRPAITKAATHFFEQAGNNMTIIFQLKNNGIESLHDNPLLTSLAEHKANISLYQLNDKEKNVNHFMVSKTKLGHYALRFEQNHKSHKATASFNDIKNGNSLVELFKSMVTKSVEIEQNNVWPCDSGTVPVTAQTSHA